MDKLNEVISLVREDENEFIELVRNQSKSELDKKLRDAKKEYETAKARYSKLDSIIQQLYEDKLEGTLTSDRFTKLSVNYEKEQNELSIRIDELEMLIKSEKDKALNIDSFIRYVKKYTEIKELTC